MTKISIVMPTKNSEKYICQAIDSVQMQSFIDWELLVCDSNSTDNTIKIIKQKIKIDKRIKIVSFEDSCVAEALNKGFKSACGKIFSWLNSDDFYTSREVFKIVNDSFYDKHNHDYLVGDFFNVDVTGNKFRSFISYLPISKLDKKFYLNQIFTGSLFFTNNSFQKFKGFNLKYKYAFEYDLLVYLLKNYIGKHKNYFFSSFRISNHQISSNKLKLKAELFEILKFYNLKYSNSKFLRLKCYLKQGSLLRFLFYKIHDILRY